jgi:hypothetical protein
MRNLMQFIHEKVHKVPVQDKRTLVKPSLGDEEFNAIYS